MKRILFLVFIAVLIISACSPQPSTPTGKPGAATVTITNTATAAVVEPTVVVQSTPTDIPINELTVFADPAVPYHASKRDDRTADHE